MTRQQLRKKLASMALRSAPPKVNPRVTPQRAIQALRKSVGGARIIAKLAAEGVPLGPSTVTQIAYFTARTRSGNAGPIDFWNADMLSWNTDLTRTYQNDQIHFEVRKRTGYDDINLHHPNGVVQAFFGIEQDAYVLIISKVSSDNAKIRQAIDSPYGTDFHVEGDGVELPMLRWLTRGVHRVNLIQRNRKKPFWFHSITCFQV